MKEITVACLLAFVLFALGVLGVSVILGSGQSGRDPLGQDQVGRYQVVGPMHGQPATWWVIDTATGDIYETQGRTRRKPQRQPLRVQDQQTEPTEV